MSGKEDDSSSGERIYSDKLSAVIMYGQAVVLARHLQEQGNEMLTPVAQKLARFLLETYGNWSAPATSLGYFIIVKPRELPDGSKQLIVETKDSAGQFTPEIVTDGRGFAATSIEVDAEAGIMYGCAGNARVALDIIEPHWDAVNIVRLGDPARKVVNPGEIW